MKLKVMTFNTQHCLNYITKKIDFDIMADTIRKCDADIIGLQEMRDEGECADYMAQTKILAEMLGYEFYFAKAADIGGNNPYGNGILSKYPITSAKTVKISEEGVNYEPPFEPRCILWAKIDVGVELDVFVTHFGLTHEEAKNAVNTVMQTVTDNSCILMGDFNLTPDSELLLPIKNKMKDAATYLKGNTFTFPSDNPKWKIDYLFVSHDLQIIDASIPNIIASDHLPHIATIE